MSSCHAEASVLRTIVTVSLSASTLTMSPVEISEQQPCALTTQGVPCSRAY